MTNNEIIIGVFATKTDAENAINELHDMDYEAKDISIITKDRAEAKEIHESTGSSVGEGAATGATTGGVIGGVAGLLVGIGAIAIPGLGALLIGGPLAATLGLTGAAATTVSGALTGALAGGLVGALAGLGIPEEDAHIYEDRIKEGGILVAVPTLDRDVAGVRNILADNNAERVKTFDLTNHKARSQMHI